MKLSDFILALVLGLVVLFLISQTQTGSNLFFSVRGSAASS